MRFGPRFDRRHRLSKALAEGSELVVDLGRDRRVLRPRDQAVPLQRAERLAEHLRRHAVEPSPQFAVAELAGSERGGGQRRPFVGDQVEHHPRRTVAKVGVGAAVFTQIQSSIHWVSIYQQGAIFTIGTWTVTIKDTPTRTVHIMRIVSQSTVGSSGVLEIGDVDRPEPDYGQVLIRVGAAGVNPVDLVIRAGAYHPRDGEEPNNAITGWAPLGDPPFTLGWDVAGVVESVGPGISAFGPGDEVLGLLAFPAAANAYADYVLASPNEIVAQPESLTVEQAGALPLAGLTAWQALVGIARVGEGQRVLVHAAAGGVGHLAVQVAKARGAHVVATASAAKHQFVRQLGADEVVDYRTTDFVDAIVPVDVVFDLVGGAYGERSAAVLEPGGLLIGAVGSHLGITPERAEELGVRLAVVSVRPSAADLNELARLIEAGQLSVHVEHAVPLAEVAKAHELLEDGHVTGKVVLVP